MAGYNGWTNYETWLCKLWMDNDAGSVAYWQEVTYEVKDIYSLAEILKDDFEMAVPDLGASFFSDLITAGLSEVNWYEIAETLWADNRTDD